MKKITLTAALLGFLFSVVEAQTVYLGIGGGLSSMSPMDDQSFLYDIGQMSWQGRFEEMTGKKSDLGFNIVSRLQFELSTLPLSITVGLSYTQLYGRADFVKAQSPPWYGTLYTSGELETHKNILSMRPGVQWAIVPSPIRVFLSLELLYNILGDTKLWIKNASMTTEGTIEGNTRMGLSIGGGGRMTLSSLLDIGIESNYSMNNLISPDAQEEARNTFNTTVSLYLRCL